MADIIYPIITLICIITAFCTGSWMTKKTLQLDIRSKDVEIAAAKREADHWRKQWAELRQKWKPDAGHPATYRDPEKENADGRVYTGRIGHPPKEIYDQWMQYYKEHEQTIHDNHIADRVALGMEDYSYLKGYKDYIDMEQYNQIEQQQVYGNDKVEDGIA